jgi:probable HAF family extracellular repeat protein
MTDLGVVDGDNSSNAFGINSTGTVVGQSWSFDLDTQNISVFHAFVWEPGGPVIDLNTLVSPPSDLNLFEADFINDRGEIVALGLTPSGDVHTAILIPNEEDKQDEANLQSMENNSSVSPVPMRPRMREFLHVRTARYQQHLDQLRKRGFVFPASTLYQGR